MEISFRLVFIANVKHNSFEFLKQVAGLVFSIVNISHSSIYVRINCQFGNHIYSHKSTSTNANMHRFRLKSMRQFHLNASWMHTIVILIIVFILDTGKFLMSYINTLMNSILSVCTAACGVHSQLSHLFLCSLYTQ